MEIELSTPITLRFIKCTRYFCNFDHMCVYILNGHKLYWNLKCLNIIKLEIILNSFILTYDKFTCIMITFSLKIEHAQCRLTIYEVELSTNWKLDVCFLLCCRVFLGFETKLSTLVSVAAIETKREKKKGCNE